jgi:hypothetical protein
MMKINRKKAVYIKPFYVLGIALGIKKWLKDQNL